MTLTIRIRAIHLLSYTLVLSSTLIYASCQDHHLFILPICACIRPSTLVSEPFFLRRTILSLFTFSNMCFFPQHHLLVLSPSSCLFPEHHLLEISVPFESRPFSLFPLYYVLASEPSSPSPLCTMVLPGSFSFDIFFQCFNPDHTLYFVFVSGSSTILFSGNVLVCIFVSGSSHLQLLYSVCTRIIAS